MEMKPIEAGISAGDGVLGAVRRSLDQSRLYDWAMRLPIVTYSLLVLGNDMLGFYQQTLAAPALLLAPGGIIATLARVSQWMFIGLLAIFPLVRYRPVVKSQDMLPRLGALITVCILPTFMLLERAPTSLAFNLASLTMSFTANVLAVLTLSFLGRSFSVMPEARRLVTDGPYGLVRHPLYVCEILGLLAILLQIARRRRSVCSGCASRFSWRGRNGRRRCLRAPFRNSRPIGGARRSCFRVSPAGAKRWPGSRSPGAAWRSSWPALSGCFSW